MLTSGSQWGLVLSQHSSRRTQTQKLLAVVPPACGSHIKRVTEGFDPGAFLTALMFSPVNSALLEPGPDFRTALLFLASPSSFSLSCKQQPAVRSARLWAASRDVWPRCCGGQRFNAGSGGRLPSQAGLGGGAHSSVPQVCRWQELRTNKTLLRALFPSVCHSKCINITLFSFLTSLKQINTYRFKRC